MLQIQPRDIADAYTLEEINIEIGLIKDAIADARSSALDKFDDMQASQAVKRQTLKDLNSDLAIYIKAKNILAGADSSTAELIAGQYNPQRPRY